MELLVAAAWPRHGKFRQLHLARCQIYFTEKMEENVCELPGKNSSQETSWIITAAKDLSPICINPERR